MTTSATVTQYYNNVIFRDPTASELASWVALIDSGALTSAQVLDSIVNSPEAQTYSAQVIRFYQAAFGRLPEATGIDGWVDQLVAGTTTTTELAVGFVLSAEWTARYGGTEVNQATLTGLYQNVLGRTPTSAEIQAWIDTGLSLDQVFIGFANSAEFQANSNNSVNTLLTTAGNTATADIATVYDPTKSLEGATTPGSTFALTSSAQTGSLDNLTGTAGNDTFNGLADGFVETGDIIDGGAGTDVLNGRFTANDQTIDPTLSNLENAFLQVDDTTGAKAFTFNGGDVSSQLWLKNATADNNADHYTFTNVGLGTTVGIEGGENGAAGVEFFAEFASATGTSDTANLALNSAKADIVDIQNVETLNISTVTGTGGSTIDNLVGDETKTINIAATTESVTLSDIDDVTTKVDASGSTKSVDVDGIGNVNFTFMGGSDNDRFDNSGNTINGNDSFDGGAGSADIFGDDATAGIKDVSLTNFERFELTAANTIDQDDIGNSISSFIFSDSAGGTNTLDDAADDVTVAVKQSDGVLDGNITINVKTNTAADDVTIQVNEDGVDANGAGHGTVTVQNWDTVNIVSNGKSTAAAGDITNVITTLTGTAGAQVNVSGKQSLTITNDITTASKVDASSLEGALDVQFEGNASPVVATGGAGKDTITGGGVIGGTSVDVLSGGANDDTLDGDLGADQLTGGDGADKFLLGNDIGSVDTITDFASGTDQILLSIEGFGNNGGLSTTTGTAISSSDFLASSSAVATDANQRFIYDTDDGKLYFDADGNAAGFTAVQIATFSGTPTLAASDLIMTSNKAGDTFVGSGQADTMVGTGGADILQGGAGVDVINLSAGGNDDVVFASADDVAGNNTISDFVVGADGLQFASSLVENLATGALNAANYIELGVASTGATADGTTDNDDDAIHAAIDGEANNTTAQVFVIVDTDGGANNFNALEIDSGLALSDATGEGFILSLNDDANATSATLYYDADFNVDGNIVLVGTITTTGTNLATANISEADFTII